MASLAASGSGNRVPGDFSPWVNTLSLPKRDSWRPRIPLSSAKSPARSMDAKQDIWLGGGCLCRTETS